MNFGRRDFLKYFGVGAVVAPVVNGLTDESTRALIIEPPKVEIAEPPKIVQFAHIGAGEYDAVIYLTSRGQPDPFTIRWDVIVNAIDLNPLVIKSGEMRFDMRGKHESFQVAERTLRRNRR